MIEYRSMLTRDMEFEGGLKLKRGTIVYAWETPSGWIGSYYPDPESGSSHCFGMKEEDFSIFRHGDTQEEYLVVVPPEPESNEEQQARRDLARRRLEAKIRSHREEAERLERVLEGGNW